MTAKKYTKQELFELYVTYNGDYKKVSGASGVSVPTLHNYSSRLGWVQQLKDMEESRKSIITELTRDSQLKVILLEHEIMSGLSGRILETIQESLPLLKATGSIKDVRQMIDVYRLLAGMPTEISEVQTKELKEEDYSSYTDAELELLSKLSQN